MLGRSLRTLPNAFIYRGKFLSDQGLAKVVIKKYSPTHQGRQVRNISSSYILRPNLLIYSKHRNLKMDSIFGRRTCKPFLLSIILMVEDLIVIQTCTNCLDTRRRRPHQALSYFYLTVCFEVKPVWKFLNT